MKDNHLSIVAVETVDRGVPRRFDSANRSTEWNAFYLFVFSHPPI